MDLLFKISLIPSSILGGLLIYKTYYSVPKYLGNEDLAGKVAIVTGASSGIGQEIAYKLALKNATLIMTCRDMIDCKVKRSKIYERTKNANIFCSELDLESYESISSFARRLKTKVNKVDLLIHSAGYRGGDKREVSKEFVEKQLAVNVIGPCMLTKKLIPVMEESGSARVLYLICPQYILGDINVHDINQVVDYDKTKAFTQSQLMRLLLVKYFSDNVSPSKITFNACDPGPTSSNFQRNANYQNNFLSRWIFAFINIWTLRHTWQAAETPLMCCASDQLNETSGCLFRDLETLEINSKALDPNAATFVYNLCDKWSKSPNPSLSNTLS